jgi:6-phosphogluconolactonase/glucosamine-6-phosphate isomerase/deaminase
MIRAIADSPDCSVVLPTGRTAKALYSSLMRSVADDDRRILERAHYLIDTETFGVEPAHPTSRHRFVKESFIDALRNIDCLIRPSQIHFFEGVVRGDRPPFFEYTEALKRYPIRLNIMAVSPAGEVSGYASGAAQSLSVTEDSCRVLTLTEVDRRYIDPNQPSQSVISIGYGNILSAQEIMILIIHPSKSYILRRLLLDDIIPSIPVTFVRLHYNVSIVVTADVYHDLNIGSCIMVRTKNEADRLMVDKT